MYDRLYLINISNRNNKNVLFDRVKEACSKLTQKKHLSILDSKDEKSFYSFKVEQNTVEIYTTSDIESFIFDSRSFIFISSQFMNIVLRDDQQSLFVDPEFKILGCSDLEIFGETRHGTLETFYPKAFSDIFVQKLIENKEYSRAFELSNNNYSLFLKNVLDMGALCKCANNTITSFLLEVCKAFKDYKVILEDEEIERLRNDLDDDLYLEDLENDVYRSKEVKYIQIEDPQIRSLLGLNKISKNRNCKILSAEMCLDYSEKSNFINELLRNLNFDKNLEIFLFIFVKFKRTDLAVKLSKMNLLRGIRYLMTLTTIEDIKNSAILSLDKRLIIDVYKIIQQDASDIITFIDSDVNFEFILCNIVEDREKALYHLIKNENVDDIKEYVKKYVLSRELLVFSCSREFSNNRIMILELFAETSTNHTKAIKVYKYLGNSDALVKLYVEKTMFREALEEYKGNKEDIYPDIGLFYELGMLYEEYLKDFNLSIENYLKSKKFADVLRVVKNSPLKRLHQRK